MKTKRILALLLTLCLVVTVITGCGKKENEEQTGEITKIKIFSDVAVSDGDAAWLEYVKQELGIELEIETPPATNYAERLNLMLASGDYPDAIMFRQLNTDFENAVKSGIIQPVNEYIEGKENLKKHIYDYSWDALRVTEDENIYGIPRSTMVRKDGYFLRADWMRNLGIEIPEDRTMTLDEFEAVLRAFTFDDPDGNGKNDTYGIASYNDSTEGMMITVEETFGLFGWQEDESGEYDYMNPKYSKTDNSYKEALAYNAKLYKDGLIDPDAPTITTYQNSVERFKRGVTGAVKAFPTWVDGYIEEMRKIDPNADICMVTTIVDENGSGKVGAEYGNGLYGFWGISAESKNAQKVVDFFDWLLSDEQWPTTMRGIENVNYKIEDGKKVDIPDAKVAITRGIMRRNTDKDFYLSNTSDYIGFDTIKAALDECMGNVIVSLDYGFNPAISSDHKFLEYKTQMAKTITQILLGEADVSAYDKALDGWYKAGGEEYVKQMNDHIRKIQEVEN